MVMGWLCDEEKKLGAMGSEDFPGKYPGTG